MGKEEDNQVSSFINRLKRNKYLWPLIIFAVIVIGISKFTNALGDIRRFLFPEKQKSEINLKNNTGVSQEYKTPETDSDSIIFTNTSPYPINWQKVKLGHKLSKLLSVYSEAEGALSTNGRYFTVNGKDNIFSHVTYYLKPNQEDPEIDNITFWFENMEAVKKVKAAALIRLDTVNYNSSALGQVMEWVDIEGISESADNRSYSLSSY